MRLKNGQKIAGPLREESSTAIAVQDAAGELRRIQVSDIATRVNGVSAMPPMNLLLTPGEIRDVVEFLSTLR